MNASRQISQDIYWIGASDRRLERFENIHPLPNGISYNTYLITDEKVTLLDTVDYSVARQFFENLDDILQGRSIDYLVLNHVEPDHSAAIRDLCRRFPNMQLVGNEKTKQFLEQFFAFETAPTFLLVKEGDELPLGKANLRFYFAPMVHWPEVMFTYETTSKLLFSADAFGTFGALPGNLFNDEVDFEADYLDEARRYYTNIVGKYGPQVQAALKKLPLDEISMLCPLHGPVWRSSLGYYLEKYNLWSSYTPEINGVLVVYGSMYGNTEHAAAVFTSKLGEAGIENMHMYDVSKTHHSYIIADIFKYSHIVFAAPTYNMGLYLPMHTLLHDMKALNLQNRKIALIANGSWAPQSHTLMQGMLAEMKGMEMLGESLVLRSSLKEEQMPALCKLAEDVAASLK